MEVPTGTSGSIRHSRLSEVKTMKRMLSSINSHSSEHTSHLTALTEPTLTLKVRVRQALVTLLGVAVFGAMMATSSPVFASDCNALVADLQNYLRSPGYPRVDAIVTTN